VSTERPRWRWCLFIVANAAFSVTPYGSRVNRAALELLGWCVLPEWLE